MLAHHGAEPHAAWSSAAQAVQAALSWNWPRPWDFSGYLAEKRHDFTGRDWLFDEVRKWYEDDDGAQAMLIRADFGVGKSAFMAELTHDAHGLQIAACHFCNHYVNATLSPATFVCSVAAQFADSLPAYRSAVEADPDARRWLDDAQLQLDPASAFARAVVGPLNAIEPPGAPHILLVDAMDEALDFKATAAISHPTTIVRLLANQAKHLPAWLRVLATSRRIQEVLQPLQNAFRYATLDGEDIRNLDDIRHYVAGRCAGAKLAPMLVEGGKSACGIAAFLSDSEQSGGKFLYAVSVLNDVESGALPLDRLNDLPPGMDGFYLDAFERRFPESEDYGPIGALLGVLCVQREPLSRAELAAILGTTEAQVGKILKQLEDFLQVRARRYAFDHLSLAQWLSEENGNGFPRAGRFSVAPRDAEVRIAAWARRELAADRAHESAYLARHLGAYLNPRERNDHFARLLLDFRWLDARLRAAGVNALLMDFEDVDETPTLKALKRRALRQSAHVLGYDNIDWSGNDLLASQILGRLQSQGDQDIQALGARATEHLRRNAGLVPLTDSLRSTEALHRTLEGHTDTVSALAVLAHGRLASGSWDGTIRVWNPATGVCETTLEGHTKQVSALEVLADGRLASGSWDETIRLWDPASGVCELMLEGHTGSVRALAVLADGRLASGSSDNTIRLWNPASGACEATLEGHTNRVSALAVLVDGRLASGSSGGYDTIKLWNPASGACEATLGGLRIRVSALAVLADGRLASGSKDGMIRLWNPVSGACEETLEGHRKGVSVLTVLADRRLASGGAEEDTIKLWNPASGICEATLEGHTYPVFALAVLADGQLASGSSDNTIRLWNPASGACEAVREGHINGVAALAVLADGRFASGSLDNTIRLWHPASGVCEATLEGHAVTTLAVLADGRLASGSWDTIELWNPTSGACEGTLEGLTGRVSALAALAEGRLASGASDNTIELWNPASGACEATLEGHAGRVTALAVLADRRLASGSYDFTIRLWNPASGTCEATLEGHTDEVAALAVLAGGRLASGSDDHTIRLWNPASGACEATLEGHTGQVTALAVLADGRLASASCDRTIRVWQERNGQWTGTVRFVADAAILALAFSPRSGVLAAGDHSGRVHFLKVDAVGIFPV
ncbi:hypothetical protein M0D69_02930 [Caballeronia sp. SEWSISQ10-4 2]|uniref:hypothetical protein n=1 Tax=Caballeronia sp. SEWSISQ10-4 2 TaxID=2937438 RepID=UPI0026504597|nr:hypothetical protein [Caballeronia sp. SEWSISQ10-4 2]MDN7176989.1 hypothetical protein [Caballeronia sp. SEWSISQ10-4 2]